MSRAYIFNQYYIDLIKKLKTTSKKHKEKSNTAKKVFTEIKSNYLTLDKNSDEYLIFINNNISDEIINSYKNIKLEDEKEKDNVTEKEKDNEDIHENENENENENLTNIANKWLTDNSELNIYNNINLSEIRKILRDDYICHHYLSIFFILSRDLPDELVVNIVNMLQQNNYEDELENMEDNDNNFKTILKNLQKIKHIKIKKSINLNLGGMENTTLGQLAKEILEDVDINKLQKSMGEDGDVLKSLGDPNSGFSDIITNVSQKMATKISSGELNQENLMKDAMKFATMMPGMFGNQQQGNGQKNSGANMGNMMSMFADLMSQNKNNDDLPDLNTMKNMAKDINTGKKGTRSGINDQGYKKLAMQKKLKKKLSNKHKQSDITNS